MYFQTIMPIINKYGDKWNERFKFDLMNENSWLSRYFNPNADAIRLWWPPEGPEGRVKLVPREQLENEFINKFSQEDRDKLKSVYALIEKFRAADLERRQKTGDAAIDKMAREMKTISQERKNKVQDLVKFAQEKLIDKITGGRDSSKLSSHEKALVAKIRSVKVTPPDDQQLKSHSACTGLVPNAFYTPVDHSINICPNFYNFPDAAILPVLAHELGHAIDPCNSQFGVCSVDHKRAQSILDNPTEDMASVLSDNNKFIAISVAADSGGPGGLTSMPFGLLTTDDSYSYLKDSGLVKPLTDGVPFEKYPFKDVFQCLTSSRGGDFREVSARDIRAMAERVVEGRQNTIGGTYDAKADKEKIIAAFNKHPECVSSGGHSQMGEAMSDWFGAEVTAEYLKGKTITDANERMAPVSFFSAIVCLGRQRKIEQEQSVQAIIESASDEVGRAMDPHPAPLKRIEDIFLRQPGLREALGCSPSDKKFCEHKYSQSSSGDGRESTKDGEVK